MPVLLASYIDLLRFSSFSVMWKFDVLMHVSPGRYVKGDGQAIV